MNWQHDLTQSELKVIKPWMWALNKANPNMPPIWSLIMPYMFAPLIVYLFFRFSGNVQPSTWTELIQAWLIYTAALTASTVFALPFIHVLKIYVYGKVKGNMMPRIGLRQEQVLKGTFFVFIHILTSGFTALVLLGCSGRGWTWEDWWPKTWIMALASLPSLIPPAFTLIAKVKLVTLLRQKKRLTNFI
ncbi:MAG: hypothetical protein EOP04_27335 [Proteobacteria bacterium]|nr:MAG: hypothetical protein EOP04_27335 [Pseudomonadota bacterium]